MCANNEKPSNFIHVIFFIELAPLRAFSNYCIPFHGALVSKRPGNDHL